VSRHRLQLRANKALPERTSGGMLRMSQGRWRSGVTEAMSDHTRPSHAMGRIATGHPRHHTRWNLYAALLITLVDQLIGYGWTHVVWDSFFSWLYGALELLGVPDADIALEQRCGDGCFNWPVPQWALVLEWRICPAIRWLFLSLLYLAAISRLGRYRSNGVYCGACGCLLKDLETAHCPQCRTGL